MSQSREPKLVYDRRARAATIKFGTHQLTVKNIDEAKAQEFMKKYAAEFARRDCVLIRDGGSDMHENVS